MGHVRKIHEWIILRVSGRITGCFKCSASPWTLGFVDFDLVCSSVCPIVRGVRLIVLVGDPHGEVPDVEDSTRPAADAPHDPQYIALLCHGHHGMVGQCYGPGKEPTAAVGCV